jgi:membrane-associated phospholipid phosphatase
MTLPVASSPDLILVPVLGLDGRSLDGSWYRAVTDFSRHTAWLHPVLSVYDIASIVGLCVMVAAAWWIARRRSDLEAMTAVAWTGLGTAICLAAGLTLKQAFAEVRPCSAFPQVVTVERCPGLTDYSFPSDHTTLIAALAVGLWLINRRLGMIAVAAALLEGFTRVYLGQHYPHDVAAAVLLSTVVMLAGWLVVRRLLRNVLRLLTRTPVRPLITARADRPIS